MTNNTPAAGHPPPSTRTTETEVPRAWVLDQRYEIRGRLGQGGMGVVFLARDRLLKRMVAIKRLNPQFFDSPSFRAAFMSEAEMMANIRHPNIVGVHDIGGRHTQPYLVMPFHEGDDLAKWAERRGGPPVELDVAAGLMAQICSGVEAMHKAGVVHGDIKPRNIIVSEPLRAVLVDLGLSRHFCTEVEPENVSGTPGYMAPELIRQERPPQSLIHKQDVYALAVTAYWLLTGELPWRSQGAMGMMIEQLDVRPTPLREYQPDLSEALEATLMRGLDPEPARRPGVEEIRSDLLHAARVYAACHRTGEAAPLVVIVDDDSDMLRLEEAAVRSVVADAEIVALTDPREALALIDERTPDLVITDLQMPTINGIELTASLRGRPATRDVPVIAVTGVGGAAEWRVLHGLGAECLVVKPFNPPTLGRAVQDVLDER